MVDPDHVGPIQSDSITTPDILRIQFGDVNVLDDDIADAVGQAQSLAPNDTSSANADDGLVGGNIDALDRRLVVGTGGYRVAAAPIGRVEVDGILASATTRVGLGDTALAVGAFALTAEIVELFVNQNHARRVVRQPLCELIDITRSCW